MQDAIKTEAMAENERRLKRLRELRESLLDTHLNDTSNDKLISLAEISIALRRRELALLRINK
jgi:hypothetical protein